MKDSEFTIEKLLINPSKLPQDSKHFKMVQSEPITLLEKSIEMHSIVKLD
jgi:hypothetical protein